MDTIKIKKGKVKMVAHRGVSGLEMENTLAAFVAAGNRSHYGIETDVHVTKDKQIAVIHDDNVKRVTGADRIVEESTLEELQSLKLYDRMEGHFRTDLRIPILSEYIGICKKYDKTAVLELKTEMQAEDIRQIIQIIRKQNFLESVIFISFSWENMLEIRRQLPKQKAQYLAMECDQELIRKLAENKLDLDIYYKAITKELVEALHAAGIEVNCWTVDLPEDAEKMVSYGVDYITSNILE